MATASFADIRRAFPRASITALVRPGRERLLEGSPDFDEVIAGGGGGGVRKLVALARRLRERRFDIAVLFTNSWRSALEVWQAGIPVRIGFRRGGRGVLLTRAVEPERLGPLRRRWKPLPMPELYARLCRAAGVEPGDGRPHLEVTDECEAAARERRAELGIAPGERLIGLVPGASFGASKLWPPARFAALADRLSERYGLRAIILSAPGEERIAAEVVACMRTAPIDTSRRPLGLGLLKPFVRDLELLITTDTGPRHVATAFGVPQLVILGPTDPRWTDANLERSEIVRRDVPCGPCQLPVCPIDHRCMESISAGEVLERIEALDRRVGVF
jgi:heptosyltransferase-2